VGPRNRVLAGVPNSPTGMGISTFFKWYYMACSDITAQVLHVKGKGRPYSITECRVPELIPVLGSQPAGDVSHKPGSRLPLFSARPAVTLATLKMAATNFASW